MSYESQGEQLLKKKGSNLNDAGDLHCIEGRKRISTEQYGDLFSALRGEITTII